MVADFGLAAMAKMIGRKREITIWYGTIADFGLAAMAKMIGRKREMYLCLASSLI